MVREISTAKKKVLFSATSTVERENYSCSSPVYGGVFNHSDADSVWAIMIDIFTPEVQHSLWHNGGSHEAFLERRMLQVLSNYH